MKTHSLLFTALMVLGQLNVPWANAEPGDKKPPALTKEERQSRAERHEKMSAMHAKMAQCLRSDKPLAECREQMHKDCPMGKDGGGCGMMEEGHGRGEHHGRGRGRTDKGEN
jgi:hypothetical protein